MERIMAHRIIYGGKEYVNHIIELDDGGKVHLYPFEHEIHSTRFISGSISVALSSDAAPLRLVVTRVKHCGREPQL